MMMKQLLSCLLISYLLPTILLSQFIPYNNIVPKPRQAYVREAFSSVFTLSKHKKIFLNPQNPSFKAAVDFNSELRKRGIDTLQTTFWLQGDSMVTGIILSVADKEVAKFFDNIPDQKIPLSLEYPGPQGYVVDILPMQLIIAGCDDIGLYYGINTFFQVFDSSLMKPAISAGRIVDAPEFPVRWVYYSTNIQVPANITKAKEIWVNASNLRLNGIQLNDSKFARISNLPKWYYDSLGSLVNFAKEKFLTLIPGFFSLSCFKKRICRN